MNQDIENVNESKNKFSWRTMCLSMAEIKGIFKFFSDHVRQKNAGVRRTIEKVEFYDEEEQCLTEKTQESDC